MCVRVCVPVYICMFVCLAGHIVDVLKAKIDHVIYFCFMRKNGGLAKKKLFNQFEGIFVFVSVHSPFISCMFLRVPFMKEK